MKKYRYLMLAALAASLPVVAWAQQAAPKVAQQTLLQKLNMPAIWILVVCSFLIVWLALDAFTKTSKEAVVPKKESDAVKDFFRSGDYVGAYNYCKANPGVYTNVVRVGLAFVSDGKHAAEEAMATQVGKENSFFQSRIAYLSVIGVVAPMIGLAGTVMGMIDAFASLGQAGAADPSKLSAAIGHVLYATAGGLVVAIPAFILFYVLRQRVTSALGLLHEELTLLFRRMPYEHLAAANVSESEIYANMPNWLQGAVADPAAAHGS